MNRNLGQTSLRRRRRNGDPMSSFDALPAPVRHWVSQAALPWSPASVRRIWSKSRAKGLSDDDVIVVLGEAEARTLTKDKHSTASLLAAKS
ncbi:hypothetical protein BVC71_12805 [Marivivens niveibacter]|uniref:Uncharacterized protein n=1 Tax=Marivivens niveibacter TaxID=1930667 RepID=A0A251WVL4_9RHOB|nr:DUF6525 family protein [Marivivens niveibacter]OUD08386.1 hypothetical protein BVC71_12805 [Marivivens niveibacter]